MKSYACLVVTLTTCSLHGSSYNSISQQSDHAHCFGVCSNIGRVVIVDILRSTLAMWWVASIGSKVYAYAWLN